MNRMKMGLAKVTQEVRPEARAKRTMPSTSVANLILHLMMDWHLYQHLGMTPTVRDRIIAGLRDGSVKPRVLCETLGIAYESVTTSDRDRSILSGAWDDLERAITAGINILGRA